MTTLENRPNSALIVIDVQNEVVDQPWNRDDVVGTIAGLVDKAREADTPVVWVQHSDDYLTIDSDGWQIAAPLSPADGEAKVRKLYRSSFEATDLEQVLADAGIGHLIVTGAETNNCVRHTIHSALERGYDVTLVSDAHTAWHGSWPGGSQDGAAIIDEQNRSFENYQLPGRSVTTSTAADVTFN